MRDFDVIDPDGNQLTFRYEIIRPSGLMSASSQTVDVCRGVALMSTTHALHEPRAQNLPSQNGRT
jgi:hypothetical protein